MMELTTVEPRRDVQEIQINGHAYKLIVELSVATGAQWQYVVVKDGKQLCKPQERRSASEAKGEAHSYAHADAGVHNHLCDGNCAPWKSERL